MKMRKILAVLLSVAMLCGIVPAFSLGSTVFAAGVAEIVNGGFETGDFTGWSSNEWAHTNTSDQKKSGSRSAQFGSHDSVWGASLEQVVPVNTGATYTLTFFHKYTMFSSTTGLTVKVLLGNTSTTCLSEEVNKTASISSSWKSNSMQFSTGTYKYAKIQFIIPTSASNDCYLDDVALTVNNAGDTSTHAAPTFINYGAAENWPKNAGSDANSPSESTNNVVTEPGFESTTNAQWNTSTFIKSNLSVINDPDARSGDKVLFYNNSTKTGTWHTFDLTLPSGGNYVLSAWVKFPYLSANAQGTASIGLINPDTDKFFMSPLAKYKGHDSTPYSQIRPTATDNEWHLRSIQFFVGSATTVKIGVYGVQSQLYIDDISVHLLENGTTYVGDQTGTISASNNTSNMYCESEDNLIPDCNMAGNVAEEFWTTAASGWNNGFMSFDNETLKFTGTSPASKKAYNYIKWIYVEPGTKYTVSFDYRVLTKGTGQLCFIDNNIDLPVAFKTYNFSSATNNMTTTSFTFNSGNYNRIGVVFTDGTAKAAFDDFRIFKTEDGIATEPEEEAVVNAALKPTHPEEGMSRMEMTETNTLGLAFLFDLEASGVGYNAATFEADLTNATVDAFDDGQSYKLIKVGAVMTNREDVGQNPDVFTLDNLDNVYNKVIDVPGDKTLKLYEDPAHPSVTGCIRYAVRITNIPEAHDQTLIYARPYYIFEYNGHEITVYGDVQFDSYVPIKDVNDGWLEWD